MVSLDSGIGYPLKVAALVGGLLSHPNPAPASETARCELGNRLWPGVERLALLQNMAVWLQSLQRSSLDETSLPARPRCLQEQCNTC